MTSRPFLLLEPGPLVPDEPHQLGDSHLLEANGLGNIANAVLGGRIGIGDYQSKVPFLADWRRKGEAYDLAPLGQRFPSANTPEFKPLPRGVLERAFTLQPGGRRLTEAEKGDLLQTNIGGYNSPATTAASGGVNTTAPSASLAGPVPAAAAPTKIKLKVKKDKKRRREGSEQPPT